LEKYLEIQFFEYKLDCKNLMSMDENLEEMLLSKVGNKANSEWLKSY
jgi:hypothetical protein